MYDKIYLTLKEICTLLGVGRNTALRICQDRVHDFPAVKVGNRWQADAEMAEAWRKRWLAGEFTINE